MVSQHFFKGTPANFAFGYFENYQDYKYPLGGTAMLPKSLLKRIEEGGGVLIKNREVVNVDPNSRFVIDNQGNKYNFDYMVWTGNLLSLYKCCDLTGFSKNN